MGKSTAKGGRAQAQATTVELTRLTPAGVANWAVNCSVLSRLSISNATTKAIKKPGGKKAGNTLPQDIFMALPAYVVGGSRRA